MVRHRNELRVPALEVHQGSHRVYSFAIDGKKLRSFTAVARIRRSADFGIEGYQRPEELSHVAAIRSYLESPDPLMPNSLVVAFDSRVRFEPAGRRRRRRVGTRWGTLVIPVNESWEEIDKPGWLVDGQQRCAAVNDAAVDFFPFLVGAFISDSIDEHRLQFLLVNSAKPLRRELIDELLPVAVGEVPLPLRRRRFPTYLVELLNHEPDSPFRGRIRTLSTPDGVVKSNAVRRMVENSLSDGVLHDYRDPEGGGDARAMVRLLVAYWSAVATVFDKAWRLPPRRSRLTHSVGIVSLGFVMDGLVEAHGVLSAEEFAQRLAPLRSVCHWTSGTWVFRHDQRRSWSELRNLGEDTRLLTDHLMIHIGLRDPRGPESSAYPGLLKTSKFER